MAGKRQVIEDLKIWLRKEHYKVTGLSIEDSGYYTGDVYHPCYITAYSTVLDKIEELERLCFKNHGC